LAAAPEQLAAMRAKRERWEAMANARVAHAGDAAVPLQRRLGAAAAQAAQDLTMRMRCA